MTKFIGRNWLTPDLLEARITDETGMIQVKLNQGAFGISSSILNKRESVCTNPNMGIDNLCQYVVIHPNDLDILLKDYRLELMGKLLSE